MHKEHKESTGEVSGVPQQEKSPERSHTNGRRQSRGQNIKTIITALLLGFMMLGKPSERVRAQEGMGPFPPPPSPVTEKLGRHPSPSSLRVISALTFEYLDENSEKGKASDLVGLLETDRIHRAWKSIRNLFRRSFFEELTKKGAKHELNPVSLNFSGGGPMESLRTVLPDVSRHILMPFFRELGITQDQFWFQLVREPSVKDFFQQGGKIFVRFSKPIPADTGKKYIGVGKQPGACYQWDPKSGRVRPKVVGLTKKEADMLSAPSLVAGGAWSRLGWMYGYSSTKGQIYIVAPNGVQTVTGFKLHADPTHPNTGMVIIRYSHPKIIKPGSTSIAQGCK